MYPKFSILLVLCMLTKRYEAIRKSKPFTCVGKVIGGYYTDVQSGCQMFHVCTLDEKGELQDIVFRCIDGTVFEQETRVCEREEEVNCAESEDFFYLNNELYGPGIIPDTANDNSFKTTGQVMTLNWLIKQPKDLQSYMTGSKYGFVRVSRPTSTWSKKIQMKSNFPSFHCDSNARSGFFADKQFGCNVFHLCIELKDGRTKLKESYYCSEHDAWFDENKGRCVTTFPSTCEKSSIRTPSSVKIKGPSENSILALCKNVGYGVLIPDLKNNCSRYFKCKFGNGKTFVEVYYCQPGMSYSSKYKLCITNYKNVCELEPLFQRAVHQTQFNIENSIKSIKLRVKRSSLFKNHDNPREASSGSLTRAGGILNDHASVIDNHSPGNIVIEGSSLLNKDKKEKVKDVLPIPVVPQMSHAKNKTLHNGTMVEVSELSSPAQDGKVTITSIIPKFVRLNGSNQPQESENAFNPGITVSAFQSKVTLSGVNATPSEDGFHKYNQMPDILKTFGNESSSDNQTRLESDSLSINETELNYFTVTTDTPETTKLMEEITTKSPNFQTTASTAETSTLHLKPSTQLSQNEIIETNFTCKDKELERFYPDVEADCKVFHYCAPGFSDDQVLDLKFLCTGNTRFDSATSKCQNTSEVSCEIPKVFHGLTSPFIEPPSTIGTNVEMKFTTRPSTSMDKSTKKITMGFSKSTESSLPMMRTSSTTTIPKTGYSSINKSTTDTSNDKTSPIYINEKMGETSVTQSTKPDNTISSAPPPFDLDTNSTHYRIELSEISTPPIIASESTSTSNVLKEINNTQETKEESTGRTTIEMLIPSTLNAEKSLLPIEQEILLENVEISPDDNLSQTENEELFNPTFRLTTNTFRAEEENITLQMETGEDLNMTSDNIIESNLTINEVTGELLFQNGSTTEENNSTEATTIQMESSTVHEGANQTTLEIDEDHTKSDVSGSSEIETHRVTQQSLSTNDVTTILTAK